MKIWTKPILFIIAICVFIFPNLRMVEAVDIIPKNIVKANVKISFLKLEKEDRNKEPMSSSYPDFNFTDNWYQKRVKEAINKYSMNRKIRIDFKLKNVYLNNYARKKDGKYEYKLFSIRWPVFAASVFNKDTGKGMYQIHSWFSGKNSKVLIEGIGYYFLQNQALSDWIGRDIIKETRSSGNLTISILDQKMSFDSVLISEKELPKDKAYNLEGYCVYGGSLISALKGVRWYPFDKYLTSLYLNFPYEETDLKLSVENVEDFESIIEFPGKKDLDNLKVRNNEDKLIKMLLQRRNGNMLYILGIIAIFLPLLLLLVPKISDVFSHRLIVHISFLILFFIFTNPPANVIKLYPIRFIVGLFGLISISTIEYLRWIKDIFNK